MFWQTRQVRFRQTFLAVVLLACVFAGAPAVSDGNAQDSRAEAIIFLGDSNYAPYEFVEAGKPVGANVDLLNAIGKTLAIPIEIRLMSWAEAQKQVHEGDRRALTLMSKNEERQKIYDFSEPTFSSTFSFFTKVENASLFNVEALTNQRIGAHKAGFPYAYLSKKHPEVTFVFIDNDLDGFGKLLSGEIDAVATSEWVGYYTLNKNKLSSIRSVQPPFAKKIASMVVPKGNPELVTKLNSAIRELKSSGEFARIIDKWSGKKVVLLEQRKVWELYSGAALVLVTVLLLVLALYFNATKRVALAREIAERVAAEEALQKAKAEAEKANKAKSEFLANMSHDLRTPLNAIMGFSSMMTERVFGPLGDHHYEEYAKDIRESGDLLISLVDDVLDLSKIEAGKFDLCEENLDISVSIDASVRMLNKHAEDNKVSIVIAHNRDLPALRGDRKTITQIINNLLSNAIKFTPQGGEITISAGKSEDDRFSICVTDTGIGMSSDDIAKALRPFEQADSRYSRKHEGSGLGLYLCALFVEMHGGEMTVESEKDRGTTVRAIFPTQRIVVEA